MVSVCISKQEFCKYEKDNVVAAGTQKNMKHKTYTISADTSGYRIVSSLCMRVRLTFISYRAARLVSSTFAHSADGGYV